MSMHSAPARRNATRTSGARVYRQVKRLAAADILPFTRALRRDEPEAFEAYVSHFTRALNAEGVCTRPWTERELRAVVLGYV